MHGGVTEASNGNASDLKISTNSWMFVNSTWTEMKFTNLSGCPLPTKLDLNWKTQCESRHYNGKIEIVTISQYEPFQMTCTNIIDLQSFSMYKVEGHLQPPFGGYILQ